MKYKIGDKLVAQEPVWAPFLRKYFPKGKIVEITSFDDLIFLPSLDKWKKYEHNTRATS